MRHPPLCSLGLVPAHVSWVPLISGLHLVSVCSDFSLERSRRSVPVPYGYVQLFFPLLASFSSSRTCSLALSLRYVPRLFPAPAPAARPCGPESLRAFALASAFALLNDLIASLFGLPFFADARRFWSLLAAF